MTLATNSSDAWDWFYCNLDNSNMKSSKYIRTVNCTRLAKVASVLRIIRKTRSEISLSLFEKYKCSGNRRTESLFRSRTAKKNINLPKIRDPGVSLTY